MRSHAAAVALALVMLFVPSARADTLITMKSHAEGMAGLEGSSLEENATVWFSADRLRADKSGLSFIVDLEGGKLYFLKHARKTYHVLDLPLDLKSLLPADQQAMAEQMARQMEMDVKITPTDQTKEITGYQAKLYKVEASNSVGLSRHIDMWMTTDVGFDVATFKKLNAAMLSLESMGGDWYKKILEIEGFPVLQETWATLAGHEARSREELVSIEKKDAPDGTYTPPADYTVEPFELLSQ